MNKITGDSFLERHTIAIYYVITFIITIILGAAYQQLNNAFISPQYAPTIGLVIICLMSHKWSVWGKMNWTPLKWIKDLFWFFVALFIPIGVILISSPLMSSFGTPFVPWKDTASGYVITIAAAILGCIFEEIGWRGFLLPKLAEKHTMFYSTIVLGLLWGAWHCKFAYGLFGFILFVIMLICFSIIMSWIFMRTNRNLFLMIIFHFGINMGSVFLLQNREGVLFYGIATLICFLICIPIVIKNKQHFFGKVLS